MLTARSYLDEIPTRFQITQSQPLFSLVIRGFTQQVWGILTFNPLIDNTPKLSQLINYVHQVVFSRIEMTFAPLTISSSLPQNLKTPRSVRNASSELEAGFQPNRDAIEPPKTRDPGFGLQDPDLSSRGYE